LINRFLKRDSSGWLCYVDVTCGNDEAAGYFVFGTSSYLRELKIIYYEQIE